MIGDYYRYIAENANNALFEVSCELALHYYQKAQEIKLSTRSGILVKLSLALNFSVFQYKQMNNLSEAINLADSALLETLDKIDELNMEEFNDAKPILETLQENLIAWKDEVGI